MMTHHRRSLPYLLLLLVAACAKPLPENLYNRDSLGPSWGEVQVSDQRRSRRMTKQDLEVRFNGTNNNVEMVRSTEVILDTEPRCLLHHEYAEILRSDDVRLDPRVRSFINHHNEIRYYICLPCRSCPPGVRILSPCHRKRDTVCSSICVNSDQVYNPNRQICVPPTPVTEAISTAGEIFIVEDWNVNLIGDEVSGWTTVSPPSHKALWSQITILTVGVLSLNVLVVVGVVLVFKRMKCKRRHRKSVGGCFNNALSTSPCHNPISAHLQTGALPSIHTRVDNRPSTVLIDESSDAHEIQGGMIQQGPVLANGELALVPNYQRTKESNLNVFHEPGSEQSVEMISVTPNDDLNSSSFIQVLRGKDPYWLVMIGQFGPEGGVLSCEDSDVILEIPPGAIPADHKDQLIVARISLRPDSVGPKLKEPDSLWLTPLVEFESPGLDRFNKDIKIRLPHCARMQPGWTFRVHYTDPTKNTRQTGHTPPTVNQDPEPETTLLEDVANSNSTWFGVEQKLHLSKFGKSYRKTSVETGDVTFTVDEKYINVSTSHFSKYCCSGCHKEHPLHLEAVVYWKHTKVEGREQMDLNVYILDPIKDSRMMVATNEKSSKCHTGYYPLILGYKKKTKEASALEICVQEDSMGDDWKWKLDTYNGCLPAKQVIHIQSLIRCCSPLLSSRQTFSFCPKTSTGNEHLSLFQTVICIKQQNSPEVHWSHILVTVPLVKPRTELLTRNDDDKEVYSGSIVTDEQIDLVVEQLPVRKWRPLYRKLMGSGADNGIEHLQAQHPNNTREQIHEALVSWRRSRGRQAMLKDLRTALETVGEVGMAESLQPGTDVKDGLLISDIGRAMCKETDV